MMVIQNNMLMRRLICIILLAGLVCPAIAKTIYVKQNANGNGTSWTG